MRMLRNILLRAPCVRRHAIARPNGNVETLLKINDYDFNWQLNYRLSEPRLIPAGTRLLWTANFDNSSNNPRNPDPEAEVRFGEQSWEEMMIGFFDVAVDAGIDKAVFVQRDVSARFSSGRPVKKYTTGETSLTARPR